MSKEPRFKPGDEIAPGTVPLVYKVIRTEWTELGERVVTKWVDDPDGIDVGFFAEDCVLVHAAP